MKRLPTILILIGISLLYSCKNREDIVKSVADEFLTEINDNSKTLNNELMTKNFADFFSDKSYYTSQNWELTVKPDNDSTILVEARSQTHNSDGKPIEILQGLYLTNTFGGWKIFNSFNLVEDKLDFKIVDPNWEFTWDREKADILTHLQKNIELKVLVSGYGSYYSDYVKGKLKIINNSDLDVKAIKVLIEHFDSEGNSVNTDNEYVWEIIRKKGYREFAWQTGDCGKCYRQEYAISFIRESN